MERKTSPDRSCLCVKSKYLQEYFIAKIKTKTKRDKTTTIIIYILCKDKLYNNAALLFKA